MPDTHATPAAGSDPATLRDALVDQLKLDGYIRTAPVEAAFRAVPRHVFVPSLAPELVYHNGAIPIKHENGRLISSVSQPAMMAIMLEQLQLAPGQRVLEIGAGSGYNAALLRYLAGKQGRVVTIELEQDLAEQARRQLAAAGFADVEVVHGDGAAGYAPAAPYERLMLTAGADDIVPAWWEQLELDGRLMMPLRVFDMLQLCVTFVRDGDHMLSTAVDGCGFVPLRGSATPRETSHDAQPLRKARLLHLLRALPLPFRLSLKLHNLVAFGHQSPEHLQIRALRSGEPYAAGAGELLLERRHTRFVLSRHNR